MNIKPLRLKWLFIVRHCYVIALLERLHKNNASHFDMLSAAKQLNS